ncbi:Lymphokine-activated killer T-cell-originated protein kinase-like [Acipenser ruthenus]|uniref:Lymphokine-activated killer T-cell-originated protein kinase-like n=1 Tax=Acipenser ruthenus TaxID=7906 RepID=A0A444U4H4_ACIRT|nr:Lymphokine-activated killer T-cell-originated protein kinase-like [Acipenser ruthenus]
MVIPASLFMQKLGCGTGVNVYLMKRYMLLFSKFEELTEFQSPWAIKKINNKCAKTQQNVYQKQLNEEAKILKNIQYSNIVGFQAFTTAKGGSKCLAMEFGGEQSLNDLIEKRREEGKKAFPAVTIQERIPLMKLTDEDAYYEALGTRPALNMEKLDESYQQVIELFSICTNEDLEMRPSAVQIVEVLEAVMREPSK